MRVSMAVLTLSCVLATTGYAVASRAGASEDLSPGARRFPSGITVGTTVGLWFSGTPTLDFTECKVERIDGGWIRCSFHAEPFGPTPLLGPNGSPEDEVWYDLGHVTRVVKRAAQR